MVANTIRGALRFLGDLRQGEVGLSTLENPAQGLTQSALLNFFTGGMANDTGIAVNHDKALTQSAVWRSVAILSGTGAALPIFSYPWEGERRRERIKLLDQPNADQTSFELRELIWIHLLLWGDSYTQKVYNGLGEIAELHPLMPGSVKVGRASDNTKVFEVTDKNGVRHPLTSQEVLHIPGLGYDGLQGLSVIQVARQSLALGIAAENFGARFFGKGSMMSGILTTEQGLDQEKADRLKKRWQEKVGGLEKAHEVAILDNGAKFQPISLPARDAQFIETRKFQVAEVARWFGLAPHMLADVEKSTSWGTGIEQQGIQFHTFTMLPWLTRIEQRITKELLRGTDRFAEHVVDGLLRGDSKSRHENYSKGRQWGFYTTNDILRMENRPTIGADGDDYLIPKNMQVKGEPVGED